MLRGKFRDVIFWLGSNLTFPEASNSFLSSQLLRLTRPGELCPEAAAEAKESAQLPRKRPAMKAAGKLYRFEVITRQIHGL